MRYAAVVASAREWTRSFGGLPAVKGRAIKDARG